MAQVIVSETKVIRITNNKNGLFRELDFYKFTTDDVLKMIVKYKIKKAIFHWYSGKIGTLNQILRYGYYFSINESMCKSKKGQNIISKLPKDRVLIETDAPFIKDVLPYKNYYVYSYLSNLWKLNIDEIINLIHTNFNQLKEFKNNRNNLLNF